MEQQKKLEVLRHSAAHLLAHAVLELFPDTLLTIGPATEEGFFYDALLSRSLKEEDLPTIEKRMQELSLKNFPIEHRQISKQEAREIFKDNPFKLELIEGIPGETVGLSSQDGFRDLCRGGHEASTGDIKYFKLLGLSGSYWRANRENQPLQRIHGTAFFTSQDLVDFETRREEAQLYDHRRLGRQLEYFSFEEEAVGFPFFFPKGKAVLNVLVSYMRKLYAEYDYQEVETPMILSDELWKRSGHYAHYKDNMYFTTVDEQSYAIKPMNCPGSILIYKHRPRSYRELPLKLAEFGHVHRHELSGVLHGLLRVRAFTQDDAHIYCTVDQVEEEVRTILNIAFRMLHKCEFASVDLALATKPAKSMGSDELWDKATNSLKAVLEGYGKPYVLKEGEGAFYGPKIEIKIKDAMNREWQCGTVQIDFFQSDNFDLHYISTSGTRERPVIIHQALYGSLERFFAILLEHFKGNLPFWLAPVQIMVLTITDAQKQYAQEVYSALKKHGLRVNLDRSSDQISSKIKAAQLEKVPWMIVIGQKEVDAGTVSVRYADGKQMLGVALEKVLSMADELNR
ncbi:threonine--tRNA ligase [Candidatus Dependentiae bacterium]|nr:threonine--tRNA ligase [Candidatus Dependentiae bacterium]